MLTKYWREALACAVYALIILVLLTWWNSFQHAPVYQHDYPEYHSGNNERPYESFTPFSVIGRNVDWIAAAITAIATGFIAWFTIVLVGVGRKADHHFQVVERAYVKMSHRSPGIIWEHPINGTFSVIVRVQNFGSTPADITDVLLNYDVLDADVIPQAPNYNRGRDPQEITNAFLVKNDEFSRRFSLLPRGWQSRRR
jgi:hypothetical protein